MKRGFRRPLHLNHTQATGGGLSVSDVHQDHHNHLHDDHDDEEERGGDEGLAFTPEAHVSGSEDEKGGRRDRVRGIASMDMCAIFHQTSVSMKERETTIDLSLLHVKLPKSASMREQVTS